MIIQVILLIATLCIFFFFFNSRNSLKVRAYKKIGLVLFIIAMSVFVISPDYLNTVAGWVGVGRGADLMLYVLIVVFIILSLNIYMKFKEQEDKIYRLARATAILEAKIRYK
jgi:hypothetical protein